MTHQRCDALRVLCQGGVMCVCDLYLMHCRMHGVIPVGMQFDGWVMHPWWRHQMETFSALWPFVREIHRSPVNSPHKGQWRGALMFSLICIWISLLSKQSWGWWFETLCRPLWRHCNASGAIFLAWLEYRCCPCREWSDGWLMDEWMGECVSEWMNERNSEWMSKLIMTNSRKGSCTV